MKPRITGLLALAVGIVIVGIAVTFFVAGKRPVEPRVPPSIREYLEDFPNATLQSISDNPPGGLIYKFSDGPNVLSVHYVPSADAIVYVDIVPASH